MTTVDGTATTTAPSRSSRTAFALLGTVQVTLIFTLAAVAVPLPRIGHEFGLRREELILLSAAYGLTFAGLLLFGGRLADRHGGRRVLTAGLLLFGAASAAAPLAPGYSTLLAARFTQGAGAALIAPAAMAVLRMVFRSPAAYSRAMATWGGLSILGATAGNLLSGVVSALASWRWALAVPLAVTAAVLALTPRVLPRDEAQAAIHQRPALDLPGALLATIGLSSASYGLVLTDAWPWTSSRVLGPLAAGAVLLAGFFWAERRTRDPLLPPRFLLDGRRALGLAATALTAAGTSTVFVLFSLHLQDSRGWSALRTSTAFVPFALALITSSRVARRLSGRYGATVVTCGGLVTGAVGLVLLALLGLDGGVPYAYGVLPGFVLLAAGAAASFAGAAVLATDRVPAERTGLAGGVHNTAMETGPTVIFALVLAVGGDAASLAATAVLFGIAALALHLGPP
ncbi:MFS transporter [Streptomyces cellulosae]|uniref:MFS transporter n=1 Tax=Streptomyces cellulosae TaxID=1968 RepID=A0ABW7Y9U7_STRCE